MIDKLETQDDIGGDNAGIAQRWNREIDIALKAWGKYHKRAGKVVDVYADERENAIGSGASKRLNILWSNTETIKPALYNQTPKAEVGRRNLDKDAVGMEASEVIERSLAYCNDSYNFDGIMEDCVHDYSLVNLAQVRVEYEPLISTIEVENDYGESVQEETLEGEYAKISYVHWTDFITNVCRNYEEVRWQGFRHFLTREQLIKLSPENGSKVPLDFAPDEVGKDDDDLFKKAVVWEIWDKGTRKVYYISKTFRDAPIAVKEPFCDFKDFFCAPKPLLGLHGKTIVPIPDYIQYQDQAKIVDELTDKLYSLSKAIKLAGVYNGNFQDLQRLVEDGGNVLIPVSDWAMFSQNGAVQGNISWLPVKEVADAMIVAYDARERAKSDIYESTGISDIVRGSSNPNETATAQSIKNQWGSLRIRKRQKDVQRFARDIMRLKAEVIAEHFSLETLKEMSGIKLLSEQEKMLLQQQAQMQPNPKFDELLRKPTWDQVYGLLRDDKLRSFSIKIETDSTMAADEQADKQSRTELLTSIAQFMNGAMPVIQQAPETANMFGAMLTFAIRGFKIGGELEGVIESTMEKIAEKVNTPPQPPQPEPKDVLKAKTDQAKIELDGKKAMMDYEIRKEDNNIRKVEILQDGMARQGGNIV